MNIYAQYCTYMFTVSDVLFNVCLNNFVMKTSSLKTGSLPVKFKALFSRINFPYERLTCILIQVIQAESRLESNQGLVDGIVKYVCQ